MESVNIHDAKTRLSQLVARAEKGEVFVIAKAGKPIARMTSIDAPVYSRQKRLGFMQGQFTVPDDFDQMGQDEIVSLFGG